MFPRGGVYCPPGGPVLIAINLQVEYIVDHALWTFTGTLERQFCTAVGAFQLDQL